MSTKQFAYSVLVLLTAVLVACAPAAPATQEYHPFPSEAAASSAAASDYSFAAPASAAASDQYLPAPAATQGSVQAYAAPAPTATPGGQQPPNGQSAGDMFFQNYGVNPSVDTEEDHLSTFALDVDTGSYTVARRYVNDGSLPPKDAIRVEEFVNYFEQDYPNPPEHQAFGINIDGAGTPFGLNEHYQMLRVGLQGYAVPPELRKDVSLTFVIDVSGSMDIENRLGLVKQALELLVRQLGSRDRVAIVVFGTEAHLVLEPTSGADKRTILGAIRSLHAEGVTNAADGLRLGYRVASRAYNPEAVNRVILCSDGVANVGATGAGSIWESIERYAKDGGITLATIGFGMGNYNDVLMEQLADHGDGFYAYVDTLAEARRLFVQNLTGTLQVIAKDAKVQVDFNPDVVARYRLVGYENRAVADEQFRDNSVDAGEIGAGHSATALYEIKLRPEARGRVATVYMRWEDPDTGQVVELSRDYRSDQIAERFEDASPRFQMAVLVAEYAEILRGSYWAHKNNAGDVLVEARRVGDLLPEDEDVSEFIDLVRQANRLSDW
jgi:Ca-activated chloride channel family protein